MSGVRSPVPARTKPLRIAIVRARYNPYGGAERFVANALQALREQGVAATVVTREWRAQPGVEALIVNPFYLGNVWRDWGFARAVCRATRDARFDLVQSHERLACCDVYSAGDGVHAEWLAQRRRATGLAGRLSMMVNPYHRFMLAQEKRLFASPRLRAIICNAAMVRDELREWFGMPAQKCHVIYSGVDTTKFSPQSRAHRETFRHQHGIPQEAHVNLSVGSGFERKGADRILRALALTGDPRQWAVIVGRDKHATRYQRLAEELGVATRVRFTGGLEDVRPAYGAADAFLLPTLYDPFPNAALEAMASGLPVVTSFKSGAAEFITPGVEGFTCDALDLATLARDMNALVRPGAARSMGDAARARVLPYSLAAMSEQLVALYRQLLGLGKDA